MTAEVTSDLYIIAAFTFVVAWFFGLLFLDRLMAFILAAVKTLIPFIYFGWFFDRQWVFSDDLNYMKQAHTLLQFKFDPISVFSGNLGLPILMYQSGGIHILYGWWNFMAQYFFGEHYYSAVFLNVAGTFIAAFAFYKLLRTLKFDQTYSRWAAAFFLIQPELLMWSSFTNLKDTMVLILTTLCLYFSVKIIEKPRLKYFIYLGITFFITSTIRFYVPVLLIAAYLVFQLKSIKKNQWGVIALGVMAAAFYISRHLSSLSKLNPMGFVGGAIRYLLTPQPWSIDPNYSFLTIPAIIHWALFLPVVVAFREIWKTNKTAQFLLIYLVIVITLYALTPDLQGPRHRVQIVPIVAWLQFHFIWSILPKFKQVFPRVAKEAP